MDKEQEFDQYCVEKNLGNRLDLSLVQFDHFFEAHLNRSRKIISQIREHPNWSRLPEIHIDIIHNPQQPFGAKSFITKNGNHFIGIYSTTIIKIHDLFDSILTDKNSLTEIGDPNLNAIVINGFTGNVMDSSEMWFSLDHGWNKEKAPKPLCPTRLYTSFHLIELAIDYILLHEIAHHLYGHVDLKKEINGLSNLDLQTLEMDADSFATNRAFWRIHQHVYNQEVNKNIQEELKYFYNSEQKAFYYWSFAIYNLMLLSAEIHTEQIFELSHIPSRVRISMILNNYLTIAYSKGKTFEFYKKYLQRLYLEAEESYSRVTGCEIKTNENKAVYSDKVMDHSSSIRENWKNIHPLLQKYTYGKLTPVIIE